MVFQCGHAINTAVSAIRIARLCHHTCDHFPETGAASDYCVNCGHVSEPIRTRTISILALASIRHFGRWLHATQQPLHSPSDLREQVAGFPKKLVANTRPRSQTLNERILFPMPEPKVTATGMEKRATSPGAVSDRQLTPLSRNMDPPGT